MTTLDWRRFTFFTSIEGCALPAVVPQSAVVASSRGLIFLGDESGAVHVVDENHQTNSFIAHPGGKVHQVAAAGGAGRDIVVSVGTDGDTDQIKLKVWNVEKSFTTDSTHQPRLLQQRVVDASGSVVSVMALHDSLSHVAIGLASGRVWLLRGDITKEKYSKLVQLHSSQYPVTCLNFYRDNLFVVTVKDAQYYQVNAKQPGRRHIDEKGCAPNCAAVTERGELVMALGAGLRCYDIEKKTQVEYPVAGEKFQLTAQGAYLAVLAKDHHLAESAFKVAIFNPDDKLNIYTGQYEHARFISFQWNSFCVFSGREELSLARLIENDIDMKLENLFSRNLFDVAISICRHHGLGARGLSEVYQRWADFLYDKGEHSQSAEKYTMTIGFLEPSYVIHKLLAAQRIESLTLYLEKLQNAGASRSEHRNLLISCYAKCHEESKLRGLLESTPASSSEGIATAIDALLRAEYTDLAFAFAEKFERHEQAVKILTDHRQEPARALKYLTKLSLQTQLAHLRKFGHELLATEETALIVLLKSILADSRVTLASIGDEGTTNSTTDETVVNVEEVFEIVDSRNDLLVDLCQFCCGLDSGKGLTQVWRRLLEIKLAQWRNKELDDGEVMAILKMDIAEPKEAVVLCRQFDFRPGLVHLLESGEELLSVYLDSQMDKEALKLCQEDPSLWQRALSAWSLRAKE